MDIIFLAIIQYMIEFHEFGKIQMSFYDRLKSVLVHV